MSFLLTQLLAVELETAANVSGDTQSKCYITKKHCSRQVKSYIHSVKKCSNQTPISWRYLKFRCRTTPQLLHFPTRTFFPFYSISLPLRWASASLGAAADPHFHVLHVPSPVIPTNIVKHLIGDVGPWLVNFSDWKSESENGQGYLAVKLVHKLHLVEKLLASFSGPCRRTYSLCPSAASPDKHYIHLEIHLLTFKPLHNLAPLYPTVSLSHKSTYPPILPSLCPLCSSLHLLPFHFEFFLW